MDSVELRSVLHQWGLSDADGSWIAMGSPIHVQLQNVCLFVYFGTKSCVLCGLWIRVGHAFTGLGSRNHCDASSSTACCSPQVAIAIQCENFHLHVDIYTFTFVSYYRALPCSINQHIINLLVSCLSHVFQGRLLSQPQCIAHLHLSEVLQS